MRRLNRIAALIAGLGVLVMMLAGALDVVATQFLGRPIPGAVEMTETMMVACIFFGLSMAQERRQHIRVELFTGKLPAAVRLILDTVADLASMVFFALIAWYGVAEALKSLRILEFTSGLIQFPVWPSKAALATGAVLMACQCLRDAAQSLVRLFAGAR